MVKKPSLVIGVAVCAALMFGAGFVASSRAQGTGAPFLRKDGGAPSEWELQLSKARASFSTARDYDSEGKEFSSVSGQYKTVFREAVGVRDRTAVIAGQILTAKESTNPEATALALMQNQKIIEQNAEIIALLKANKGK